MGHVETEVLEKGDYPGLGDGFFRRHGITLPVEVEAPRVNVALDVFGAHGFRFEFLYFLVLAW